MPSEFLNTLTTVAVSFDPLRFKARTPLHSRSIRQPTRTTPSGQERRQRNSAAQDIDPADLVRPRIEFVEQFYLHISVRVAFRFIQTEAIELWGNAVAERLVRGEQRSSPQEIAVSCQKTVVRGRSQVEFTPNSTETPMVNWGA